VLVHPQFDPVAFAFGPLAVRWYGLMYLAGFVFVIVLGKWRVRHGPSYGVTDKDIDDMLFYGVLGVILGGRLGYVLFYEPRFFASHPLEIPAVWNGGMSFHGALLGSILAMVLFARRIGADAWSVMDLSAAATPMGLFFGRLANFINAELWGRPSNVPWAMTFPGAGPMPRHPSQLYEAALEGLVLFAVLWWLTHSKLALRRPGMIAGAFLIGYGVARSFSELFREPDPGHLFTVGPFTAGILYSLPMVLVGIWMIRRAGRRTAASIDVQRSG